MELALGRGTRRRRRGRGAGGRGHAGRRCVVAARHNERERQPTRPPTRRCWRCAIRRPPSGTGGSRDVTLVVTLEPCPMCAGALVAARVAARLRGGRPPGGGLRHALQPLCRPPAQPRAARDRRRAGGRMRRPPDLVLRRQAGRSGAVGLRTPLRWSPPDGRRHEAGRAAHTTDPMHGPADAVARSGPGGRPGDRSRATRS